MRSSASTGGHPGLRSYIRQPDQPPLTWADAEAINASPKLALGSAEQFDLVTRRLAANQRDARRNTTHPYLLRGLVSCGVCRLSCSGVTRTANDTRYRYYRCRGKLALVSSGRSSRCPARFIPATQLDELVWADLCAVLQQPQQVAQALERARSGAWVPQELRRRQATLQQARASVARQRQRLLEAYLAEVINLDTFQRQDRTLGQQETDLLAREREVAAQGERLAEVNGIAQSMTQVLQQLRVGLGQAGFEQRRQLVELLIDRVLVTDGQVEIRYVIPTTDHSTKTRFCHLRTDYFDHVAALVAHRVEPTRPSRAALLVAAGGDGVGDPAAAQQGPAGGIAVAGDGVGHTTVGLARIWLEINPDNTPSLQLAERASYRLKQRLPRHCRAWTSDDPDHDTWHDWLIWTHTT